LFQAGHRCPKETIVKVAGGNIMRHEANYPSCVHDDIHPCTKEDEEEAIFEIQSISYGD
jgi:hypothetical protein